MALTTLKHGFAVSLLALLATACAERDSAAEPKTELMPQAQRLALANCLAERGWVMYGTSTCRICRAQRKAFGAAFSLIREVECNPHAAHAQTSLCVANKIRQFPTWVVAIEGREERRLEGLQSLERLASIAGCSLNGYAQESRQGAQ